MLFESIECSLQLKVYFTLAAFKKFLFEGRSVFRSWQKVTDRERVEFLAKNKKSLSFVKIA